MSGFLEEYAGFVAAHGRPERIELMLCDLNAVIRGKWLPGDDAAKLAAGEVRLPLSTYAPNILGEEVEATGLGIVAGDPDGRLIPVPGTLKPMPWASAEGRGKVAQVLVEMHEPPASHDTRGALPFTSPRGRLAAMQARLAERGLRPVVATELEFYLIRPRARPEEPPRPPEHSPDAQNYDLEVLEKHQGVLDAILAAAEAQGIPTDTLIAEYGPGQFEVNFHHTEDVMFAADMALWFRRLVRGVARQHGFEATFMAKPYADHPGNGMHVHVSVVDADGRNIFAAESGVGDRLGAAVAGLLETMREMQAIFAPHLNSYRRFLPMSFAPSAPDWGLDNRAAAIRLPETRGAGARLEHRICGADVNPYLALAAILGGMLHGLETGPDLPLPLDDPAARPAAPLGHDWAGAVERFAASETAAEIFGAPFRDLYAEVRRDEIARLTREISQVEYRTYLGRL